MIVLYLYLLIGLVWFLIISIYSWREFNGLKFLVGILAYPLLFPLFFHLQLKKVFIFKKTLKGFNTFKFLIFNDYGFRGKEVNYNFSDNYFNSKKVDEDVFSLLFSFKY